MLCAPGGEVLAEATIEHVLSLPRPGWAEHDADAIWWGEFVGLTRRLLDGRFSGEDVGGDARCDGSIGAPRAAEVLRL